MQLTVLDTLLLSCITEVITYRSQQNMKNQCHSTSGILWSVSNQLS